MATVLSRTSLVFALITLLSGGTVAASSIDDWLGGPGVSWRLTFSGPGGASKEIAGTELQPARNGSKLTWTVPLTPDDSATVTATVRTEKRSALSYWSLRATLPSGWRVVRSDFPFIPSIRRTEGLKMAVPAGWGIEYDARPGMVYNGAYPSCTMGMQFVAFYDDRRGLYIGAHDPKGLVKMFTTNASDDGVSHLCTNWPAASESAGGRYSVPYETAIGVFDGGYYEAAQIYREFTFKCDWGKAGPISKRPIPQWLKDTDLWLMSELEPWVDLELAPKALDFFGPFAFHWYRWSRTMFDTLYPDYFPPKPGFAGGIRQMQSMGIRVMPYINGRLADPESRAWRDESLEKAAVKLGDGKLFPEVYDTKVPLNVMCPGASQWQEKIADVGERLAKQYGVDAVYIDQIACAGPIRCFDASHGHLPGENSVWAAGYREMLDRLRRRIPSDVALATEENAECYIDKFDLQLMANTPTSDARPIPLYPAVYSGRSLAYAFQYNGSDDVRRSLPFRAKMARAFVWGAQVGWVRMKLILEPDARKEAEFLRNLARCRRFGHEYVVTGRFLGMLDARGDFPHMTGDAAGTFGGTYRIDLPAVLASAWLAEDNSVGILLANMSDEAHAVEVDAPIRDDKRFLAKVYGPDGLISSTTTPSGRQKVEIPARSALIISLVRAGT